MTAPGTDSAAPALRRDLGIVSASLLVVGGIIGSGLVVFGIGFLGIVQPVSFQ